MKNRFLMTIGILLFGVSLTKAGIREDLEAANRIPDEQWLEKAKVFISVFDDLREALAKKWKEVGGDLLGTSPFNLYAWKNNQFVNSDDGWDYINEEEHEVCSCGLHLLRGICCYPCVQCSEDTGLEKKDCFDAWMFGTPFWCCIGLFDACCSKDLHPITDDYFTLNIYKPICEDWLLPLLGIKKGKKKNCRKLYNYWMENFCEPVANVLQTILKQDFTQFSVNQIDTFLNLYNRYLDHGNWESLALLPFWDVIPNRINDKLANLIVDNLKIAHGETLRYLAILLALDWGMTNEELGCTVHNLGWYGPRVLEIFKILVSKSAIQEIQIHASIKDAFEVFLKRAQELEQKNKAYNEGSAAGSGFRYAARYL